jgi:hypothetical protein
MRETQVFTDTWKASCEDIEEFGELNIWQFGILKMDELNQEMPNNI